MTLREAESVTGLSRTRLLKMIKAGELPSEKRLSDVGGAQRFVRPADVAELVKRRQEEAQQRQERKAPGRPLKQPGTDRTVS